MFLKVVLELIKAFSDGRLTWEEVTHILNIIKDNK
jgi:acetone carboxylase gamma subunit